MTSPFRRYDRDVTSTTSDERPLRADAERNRARILAAAAEVFASYGLDATLHDIAEHAGVGVGTVYRRFPDKEALVEALFEDKVKQLTELAEFACSQPDAWSALVGFLRSVASLQAVNRGLQEILHGSGYGQERVASARDALMPLLASMLERAQEQGAARRDVEPADLSVILLMLSSLSLYTHEIRPDAWQRYLDLILDGVRVAPGRGQLGSSALTEDELQGAMASWHRKRRS